MAMLSARLRNSRLYPVFQKLLRLFQFLSAAISLALFSARIYKIIRLSRRASVSNGAVEGILAAAVLYTLVATLLTFVLRSGGPNIIRYLMVLFDILFVGAFIAVGCLTRPNHGGSSGPCQQKVTNRTGIKVPSGVNCNLPWGTFVLAILSTILHALTAIFHEAKDRHHHKVDRQMTDGNYDHGSHEGKYHENGVNGHGRKGAKHHGHNGVGNNLGNGEKYHGQDGFGNQNGNADNYQNNGVGNHHANGGNYGNNGMGNNHQGNGIGNQQYGNGVDHHGHNVGNHHGNVGDNAY